MAYLRGIAPLRKRTWCKLLSLESCPVFTFSLCASCARMYIFEVFPCHAVRFFLCSDRLFLCSLFYDLPLWFHTITHRFIFMNTLCYKCVLPAWVHIHWNKAFRAPIWCATLLQAFDSHEDQSGRCFSTGYTALPQAFYVTANKKMSMLRSISITVLIQSRSQVTKQRSRDFQIRFNRITKRERSYRSHATENEIRHSGNAFDRSFISE